MTRPDRRALLRLTLCLAAPLGVLGTLDGGSGLAGPPPPPRLFPTAPPPPPPPAGGNERKRIDLMLTDPRLGGRDTLTGPAVGDWAAARRSIEARFQPTRTLITDDDKASVALRQLTNNPAPSDNPPTRRLTPDENVEIQDATEAAQRAYERPTYSRAAEVTALTDEGGRPVSVVLSVPSGSRSFDEVAVEAVRRGLAERPPAPEPAEVRRPMQSRWQVRAGYAVTLPRAVPKMAPRSANARMPVRGLPIPVPVWGTFDESRGTVREGRAFTDKLETEVRLLSLQPAPVPPPSEPAPQPQ
jgi:hypothetical protein